MNQKQQQQADEKLIKEHVEWFKETAGFIYYKLQ